MTQLDGNIGEKSLMVSHTSFHLFSLRLDFIYDLFEKVGSRNSEEKMGTARRKPTVSSQFRVRDALSFIADRSFVQIK